jgi:diguanylate cyclase (GGDEF)-like protein
VTPLDRYVLVVVLAGAAVLADVVVRAVSAGGALQAPSALVLVLVALMVVGEARPIVLSRRDGHVDEVTSSSTFILALALLGPLWLLVPAQALSAGLDDLRRRRDGRRIAFNIAQLMIAAAATRAVFCLLTGRGYLADDRVFALADLLPALAAGAVFFLVNNGLTGVAVALWRGRAVSTQLREDMRFQLSTSGVLLSAAPVVVVAGTFSLWLLPLMLLPLIAVHHSARLAAERQRQSLHDGLTGLPNRTLLVQRTTEALLAARTGSGTAVLLIDLDHFKQINDTLGHHVGDQLLREVAMRLTSALRDSDSVARLGGDEFAVLAVELLGQADAEEVAGRIVTALERPFDVEGVRLDVQASVGIALSPEHGTDVSTLLQRADVALYAAKEDRGCYAFYASDGELHGLEKLALLGELREGIGRGELAVHYQPTCRAATGRLVAVEALVRWQHPTRGLLPPDDFVPIAENIGMIGALTLEVLDQAIGTARRLRDAGHPLQVSVNLSVRLLTDLELPSRVAGLLGQWGMPPECLVLEVTEDSIMVDPERAMTVLGRLRDLGVVLSIDDFGTGYSSLAYLRQLRPQELKIDKSLVGALTSSSDDAVLVRSAIELGHNLGLRVVAEGVDDVDTWAMLTALGCDAVQGYSLSQALPEPVLLGWLASYAQRDKPFPLPTQPHGRTLQP